MGNAEYEIEQRTKTKEEKIMKGRDFEKKLSKFKNYPKSDLIILSDFDQTFTKRKFNGKGIYSSYQIFDNSKSVSSNNKYLSQIDDLFQKYGKYERDISVPFEERLEKIKYWYIQDLKLKSKLGFNKRDFDSFLDEAIISGGIKFRKGLLNFLGLIKERKIPLVILSGGISEVIETCLRKLIGDSEFEDLVNEKLLNIIGNKFVYNEEGNVVDIQTPIIHTFNKDKFALKAVNELGKEGGNFIVVGDHMNDMDMINSTKYKEIIGVGFDNYIKGDSFLERYDICIQGDGDFDFISNMVDIITKEKRK